MIAVVLAAGRGLRMGGPKALIPWGEAGVPMAIAHARAMREAGAHSVVVVVREDHRLALGPWITEPWLSLVCSHAPEALGPAGSLCAALLSLDGDFQNSIVAVTPVDALPVTPEVMAALLPRVGRSAAKPVYQNLGGHPVLVHGSQLLVYLREGDPPALRDVLRALGEGLVRVPVGEPGVTIDFDTPEDLRAWAMF